jgi:hypothetical protein
MKLATTIICIIALALPAFANDLKLIPTENGASADRVDCDVSGCDYYGMSVGETFDATGGPLTFGPLTTGGSCAITNVVLSVNINQTWCGDLVIDLYYDENNDGIYDFGPVSALCRPALDGCAYDGCCGCSGDVLGTYTFGDDGADPLGEVECGDIIPTGCYMPAIETPAGFADTFAGAAAGGHFYLEIADGAAGDETTLIDWGVYVCCGTTASETTNWGKVKSDF